MSIIRRKKSNNFSVISNHCLRNEALSWKAKGLFAYIMTLPDDWKLFRTELINHATDGKDSTRSGFEELIDAGYIVASQVRKRSGQLGGWEYTVHECPIAENPIAENPPSVNPPLLNTKEEPNTENTKLSSLRSSDNPAAEKRKDGEEEETPALKDTKKRVKFEDKTFQTSTGATVTYGDAAEVLAVRLISRLEDAIGRKPRCTVASCKKPLLKLLKSEKARRLAEVVDFVTTPEYIADEYKPEVLSASALYDKFDRVVSKMPNGHKAAAEKTYVVGGDIYFPTQERVCGQIKSRKATADEVAVHKKRKLYADKKSDVPNEWMMK